MDWLGERAALTGAVVGLGLGLLTAGLAPAAALWATPCLGVAGFFLGARQAAARRERRLAAEVERLRQLNAILTDATSEGLALEDAAGRLRMVNPTLLRWLDYAPDELIGAPWSTIVAPASQTVVAEHTARRPGGVASSYEARLLAKDGYEVPVLVSATPFQRDGQYAGTLAVLINIADRLRNEAALQRANEHLSAALSDQSARAQETLFLNRLIEALQACADAPEAWAILAQTVPNLFADEAGGLYLLAEPEAPAQRVTQWGDGLALAETYPLADWPAASGPEVFSPRLMSQATALGGLVVRLSSTRPARQRWAQAVADSLALALANLRLRETLRQQSIRDALTGLYNRRYMEEALERELRRAERRDEPVSVILLDLDHFKDLNDTFGHPAGDAVLRAVGAVLSRLVRAEDVVCRYGGEEFILILPAATADHARQRAQALRQEIRRLRPEHHGRPLGSFTVSAGVAAWPASAAAAAQLLSAADTALYAAKRQGRDCVVVAPPLTVVDHAPQGAPPISEEN